MKPLTIDELKALEVGDWVWCIQKEPRERGYMQKSDKSNEYFFDSKEWLCPYSGYGKTWLAYKNKEQAESKGEIVELPRFLAHLKEVERRLAELKGV